jgi:hypothetical protein
MNVYADQSTRLATNTTSDSDMSMPSLIHMNGYTATTNAATIPTAAPARRYPTMPTTTIAPTPRRHDASRCPVTPSTPSSDQNARYVVYSGGCPAPARSMWSKCQASGSTKKAPFASAFACQWKYAASPHNR